ncbi:MAG TPA: HlyD family efflux transporter periplasmic adaptor subunit [Bryobacteraceae bacterium]|nr:HlyD family efflux transporter periplasmic adaptor subunit [Bryobacteraceae bacterium]
MLAHHNRPAPKAPAPAARPASAVAEVTLSGKIRAQHITPVTAPLGGGAVEAFLVDVGDQVYEGETLARVGSESLDAARQSAAAAVDAAQAEVSKWETAIASGRLESSRADASAQHARDLLDQAQKTYERQKMLFGEGATPRLVYEKSEHEYQSAQREFSTLDASSRAANDQLQGMVQELAVARRILDDKQRALDSAQSAANAADIVSPVDGLVVERSGEVGQPVNDYGGALFQIATDVAALEVALTPDAPTLKRIHAGAPALVLVPDLQSDAIDGTVRGVKGPEALVDFISPMPAIQPGMRADVRLKLD